MKLAIIAPHDLELAAIGDCQFALAQEVDDTNEAWYRGRAGWDDQIVILDHGAFELGRAAVDREAYMDIAERIGATDVLAPDVQWNAKETLKLSSAFSKWFYRNKYDADFKLMSVVWSSGPGDFGEYFEKHMEEVAPDIFGIGKWYESMYADGSRAQLIRGLKQIYDIKPEQLHALGCPYPQEVYNLRHMIRSMDTGIATKAALQGIWLDETQNLNKRVQSVPLEKLPKSHMTSARHNAKMLLKLAQSD